MYNTDWNKFVEDNSPRFWRTSQRRRWLRVLIQPIVYLHNLFLGFRLSSIYEVTHTSQTIYFQKRLNDKFSSTNGGIIIDNTSDEIPKTYLFSKVEQQPSVYVFSKWQSIYNYQIGHFATFGDRVWQCVQNHTNQQPSITSSYWLDYGPRTYIFSKSEYNTGYDFKIMIPVALVYDIDELKAYVNKYKLAGTRYIIESYL